MPTGAGPARRRESDPHDPPRAARPAELVWPLLLAMLLIPFGFRGDGPGARRRTGRDARPVLHHHRADHLRDRPEDPRGHARVRRRQRPGRAGKRPILVFEFVPGETAPGSSDRGVCSDLADVISGLGGPSSRSPTCRSRSAGFAVLPVVACTEIVMGSSASIGPITPEGQPFDAGL